MNTITCSYCGKKYIKGEVEAGCPKCHKVPVDIELPIEKWRYIISESKRLQITPDEFIEKNLERWLIMEELK